MSKHLNMRPKILYHPDEYSNLLAVFLQPIWQRYFDIAPIEPDKIYDPHTHVIWVYRFRKSDWYLSWQEKGHKIIIDNFWDSPVNLLPQRQDNVLTMCMPNWSWYNESLWYQDLGYFGYQRNPRDQYFALMLMRRILQHRDDILRSIGSMRSDILHSYVHRGIVLPDDLDDDDVGHQRYFNPKWYDSSQFSIVVESKCDVPYFLSEKIFKPMAFQHAFLVWGPPQALAYLHSQGFETFDHVIDESYDDISDPSTRLAKIMEECRRLHDIWQKDRVLFEDTQSKEKILYNHNRFYHPDVQEWFVQDGVHPIMEFLES